MPIIGYFWSDLYRPNGARILRTVPKTDKIVSYYFSILTYFHFRWLPFKGFLVTILLMKGARLLLFVLCLLSALPLMAGGVVRFWRPKNLKIPAQQEAYLQALISRKLSRSALLANQTVHIAQQDRIAFFNSPQFVPFQSMATLSVPMASPLPAEDLLFAVRNDEMAFSWLDIVGKDLQFLTNHQADMLNTLRIGHIAVDEINYAELIPSDVRKIYVGEEHRQPVIYEAFEKLVLQYQAMYPDRPLIVLTEFVSDRLLPWQTPGRPVHALELPLRQNDKQFSFFKRLIRQGIQVIGLENVAYIKEHETLITPAETQAQSVYGMQERNAHWRRIISYVAMQNPQAVLFVYVGSMHTHYRAPFTLTNPSDQNFVFQLEADHLGPDMPFGFVMQEHPVSTVVGQDITVLSWPRSDSIFRTRSGFDVCLIFPSVIKE